MYWLLKLWWNLIANLHAAKGVLVSLVHPAQESDGTFFSAHIVIQASFLWEIVWVLHAKAHLGPAVSVQLGTLLAVRSFNYGKFTGMPHAACIQLYFHCNYGNRRRLVRKCQSMGTHACVAQGCSLYPWNCLTSSCKLVLVIQIDVCLCVCEYIYVHTHLQKKTGHFSRWYEVLGSLQPGEQLVEVLEIAPCVEERREDLFLRGFFKILNFKSTRLNSDSPEGKLGDNIALVQF